MIKIYKIWSPKGDKIYVGSTGKQYLCSRKADHWSKYRMYTQGKKKCASYEMFDEYGLDNCVMQLIEECELDVRYDRERYWIEKLCAINIKKKPRQTKEEKDMYKHEWRLKLKESNPELYHERQRKYTESAWEKQHETIQCECGNSYIRQHKARHLKTLRHLSNS
jgi:hypothetical protein